MATKSFTTDLRFNRKSATGLIKALKSSDRKVKRSAPTKVKEIKDQESIRMMFSKGWMWVSIP